jgi:transcriptional regulator with XRE-family HTH domain
MNEIATFARNVAAARARRRLTQSQVSERSGIHFTEVSRIERGLRDPRLTTVVRLARALKVRPGHLLDGIERHAGGPADHGTERTARSKALRPD